MATPGPEPSAEPVPAPPSRSARIPVAAVAPLLLGSGFCALAYQVAWTRGFRLTFGASTAASAAVLAVFMGGLGLGGWLLGPRADRHPRPLLFYAALEALVAALAAASPLLMAGISAVYLALGGTVVLGTWGGTAVRLALAALVLLPPTVLAGGTLGAAARSVESADDLRRRGTALLYGVNTLGALAGCVATTFLLLEALGTRATLWTAAALNLAIAAAAAALARGRPPLPASAAVPEVEAAGTPEAAPAPARFVLLAAAIVGFAFFLMELVWYRMLGPILGGTVYTFGLVLAVALAGIALGGILYSAARQRGTPDLHTFALTCLGESAFMALPYVLGDRLALLTLRLHPGPAAGLWAHVGGWAVVASIVILPAAVMAGVQFPVLIALLGTGRERVARHVGLAYLWNTLGAIVGSLAGGFGLLPLLSAPGCWRAVALLLAGTGLLATLAAPRRRPAVSALALAAAAVIGVALFTAHGPTAAWRHSGVGVGRVISFGAAPGSGPNADRAWLNENRRFIVWERDGVESSVALHALDSLAFVVNGKIDGNARGDAPTQVMSGLLGTLVKPGETKSTLVIGLGTGSTAGWLAAVPSIERTDVVELEPAILHVARACTAVNHDALANPRLHVVLGDAREVLTTTPQRYDIVFSEPSNPYRAGIASLFTREFYQAVKARLRPNGLFLQWVQAYDIDKDTVATILATLADVYPEVEVWQTHHRDLVLLASQEPLRHDLGVLRERMAQEPFASALRDTWRVTDVHELLGRFVAGPALARHVRDSGQRINTDDRNPVEFSFARMVAAGMFDLADLRRLAESLGATRPALAGADEVDWARVLRHQIDPYTSVPRTVPIPDGLAPADRAAAEAQVFYANGNLQDALRAFRRQPRPPRSLIEIALNAEALADEGSLDATPFIMALGSAVPAEGDAATARLALRRGRPDVATGALLSAFERYRVNPWPSPYAMARAVRLTEEIVAERPEAAAPLFESLGTPFAVRGVEQARISTRLRIASMAGLWDRCREALAPMEPHVPWREDVLGYRVRCYTGHRDPRADAAAADLERFRADAR
jgi:spermidine synthase